MSGLYRVLVVDDEMLIRQGIINYIDWEQEGFEIVGEASNGKEALELIKNSQPHIILTDIVMPEMDGIELVRMVKENYPSIEIIVLSSFEDFDYVRSTFQNGVADYILKPKLNGVELIKTLKRIVPGKLFIKENAPAPLSLERVLNKYMFGNSLMAEEEELLIGFPYNGFSLMAVPEMEKEEFCSQLSSAQLYFIQLNESGITIVLVNFEKEQWISIRQKLTRMAQHSNEDGWLVSGMFSSIYQLNTVYENHLSQMERFIFYLDEPILFYDSLPEVEKICKPFDLSRFIDLFKQKKFEHAIDSLRDHVDGLTRNYTNDIFEFKSFLENIIFNSIVLLGNMKYAVEELEAGKYDYFKTINEAQHAREAVTSFDDFLSSVENIALTEISKSCPPDMQRLLDYMENHYAEPLSLTILAEYFHFNPSYLSSYFSNHHNVGFSDYLNQVRIEKAKQMLESSTVSISEVSELVGYSEPSYFCKVFKRLEGSSPGRYRKKNLLVN